MPNPTKTVFDFPREQWDNVELQNASGGWNSRQEWSKWHFGYASEREARLVKREPRTASGTCSGNWRAITLGDLAINVPQYSAVRYTLTEVLPGAEPEPDWKAECEAAKKELLATRDAYRRSGVVIDVKIARILELEGSLAAASAAVQKLEVWRNGLERIGPIYGVEANSVVWLEKVSE